MEADADDGSAHDAAAKKTATALRKRVTVA
jgi:hypothetical protein